MINMDKFWFCLQITISTHVSRMMGEKKGEKDDVYVEIFLKGSKRASVH